MNVAIIGGGASGITCAVELKRKNADIDVTVFEKLPRILKKILVTGNGRCNLTNENSSEKFYRGDSKLLYAIRKFPYESTVEFFNSLGVMTRAEAGGRVYPVSSQASGVVSALLNEAETLGVEILTDTPVTDIKEENRGFVINGRYRADRVVIASGGSAAKSQGTDGDSFKLLKNSGVNITPPRPALTGVIIGGFPKSLKGIRNRCEIKLLKNGEEIYRETGEIQFNDYGISGIPVMQLSSLIDNERDYSLGLDFLPDFDKKQISSFIEKQINVHPGKSAELLFSGLLPKALGNYLLLEAGIKKDRTLDSFTAGTFDNSVDILKSKTYGKLSLRDFEYAQVTAGGVGSDEINPETLELRKHTGIYVTGEALNVDGMCGGHNLQFAWATGRLAAESILKDAEN